MSPASAGPPQLAHSPRATSRRKARHNSYRVKRPATRESATPDPRPSNSPTSAPSAPRHDQFTVSGIGPLTREDGAVLLNSNRIPNPLFPSLIHIVRKRHVKETTLKKMLLPSIALLGMAALAIIPGFPASAATTHTPPAARVSSAPGMVVRVTPGAHAFSVRIPITSALARSLARSPRPNYQGIWKPRVYCNGGSSGPWSGFNANIKWGGNGSIAIPAYLDVWGQVWDGCGGTAYAYLSYTNGLSSHNDQIGKAPYFKTAGVNVSHGSDFATYGNIRVDVCESYNGWRCGKALGP